MSNPNIIYIYGDDLGRGMLSCYGQNTSNPQLSTASPVKACNSPAPMAASFAPRRAPAS